MSQCNPGQVLSFVQEGDLTAACYQVVQQGATDKSVKIAGAGTLNIGVVFKNPNSTTDAVAVVISGSAMVKAGGNITRGNYLITDTNGDVVASTPTDKDKIIGIAMESAVDNDIFEMTIAIFTMSV